MHLCINIAKECNIIRKYILYFVCVLRSTQYTRNVDIERLLNVNNKFIVFQNQDNSEQMYWSRATRNKEKSLVIPIEIKSWARIVLVCCLYGWWVCGVAYW